MKRLFLFIALLSVFLGVSACTNNPQLRVRNSEDTMPKNYLGGLNTNVTLSFDGAMFNITELKGGAETGYQTVNDGLMHVVGIYYNGEGLTQDLEYDMEVGKKYTFEYKNRNLNNSVTEDAQ